MTDQWLPTSSTSSRMMLGKYKPQPMHLQQWSSTGKSFNQKPSEAWASFPLATFHHRHESYIRMPTCFGVICTVVATTCWETFLMSPTSRQFSCYDCWKEWDAQETKSIVPPPTFLLWLLEGMGCSADKSHCGNPGAALCRKAQKTSNLPEQGCAWWKCKTTRRSSWRRAIWFIGYTPRHEWWAVPPQGWYPFEMG